jgi:hypothetical protein
MDNQIVSLRDSFFSGITTFMNFIPTLLGAAVVLAVGWFLSTFVARLVERVLISLKLDEVSGRTGMDRYLVGPQGNYRASQGVGILAKWFVRLIFLQAAANLLNMPQVTTIINNILMFIPNLAVALLIVVVGVYLGRFIAGVVQQATAKAGMNRPDLFSIIARYAINGFAIIAALNHIGIAVSVVNTLFVGLVASLSLALGLSFGLGGQGVASDVTRSWYNQRKSENLKVLSGGQTSSIRKEDDPHSSEKKKTF